MKRILLLHLVLLLCNGLCYAQTNSIDIGSANQNINPATTFNAWTVFAEGPDMQNALCFNDGSGKGNSFGPPGSTPTSALLVPAAIGSNAYSLTTYSAWPSGTYLSCFNGNTIYTPEATTQDGILSGQPYNISNCTMTIRRKFIVCSNTSQTVNFSLTMTVDNYLTSVVIDADSAHPVTIYNTGAFTIPSSVTATGASLLTPGAHTIDIKCADGDWLNPTTSPGGSWYPYASTFYQWNPFGIAVTGNITTAGNVLLNTTSAPAIAAITGNSNTCANSTTTLSDVTAGGSWSSSNTAIATVSAAGVVTGIAPGNVVISYIVGTGPCSSTATLNFTVTDCTSSCNNWLQNTTAFSGATIGNLGVSGNQLTVEAEFNSSVPLSTTVYDPAIVSKHSDPGDCNFVLRTDLAELSTTTNGLVIAQAPCIFEPNKTYHVAMVYDGSTLKFYRDGFLMSSVPQTGNMVANGWLTTIGEKAGGGGSESLIGNINEVRIWNVARTQAQLRAYMNTSLPSPSTQPGLLGYYIFNDLLNKQGNSTYNGTLFGSASINATNPNCSFHADSCCTTSTITIDTTLCQGQSYLGHTTSGTYIDTLIKTGGCDSIITTNLTINNACSASCAITNNIIITTGYNSSTQASIPAGQQDSGWIVTAKSIDMQNAFSNANTSSPTAPFGTTVSPVNIGQPAYVVQTYPLPWVQSYTYLSCFPYNTMYTPHPFVTNISSCTMNITRTFYVKGPGNQTVHLNFLVSTDDVNGGVTIDAGTPGVISLSPGGFLGLNPWLTINTNVSLTPGPHTLTILCDNGEDVNGIYYSLPSGASAQYNPFGVAVVGNITTAGNVLQNKLCCSPTYSTLDTTICPGQIYRGHSTAGIYKDTIVNVAGCDSIITLNLTIVQNIDSVKFSSTPISCDSFYFYANAYTKGVGIHDWTWMYGDNWTLARGYAPGLSVLTDSSGRRYAHPGTYQVKLIAVDLNGCTDTTINTVTVSSATVNAGNDSLVCKNSSFTLSGSGANIVQYTWTPKIHLNDSTLQNPTASIPTTTKFYLTGTNVAGCSGTDSVTITVQNVPVKTNNDTAVCAGNTAQLNTSGANTYGWLPSTGLTNVGIANPVDTSTAAGTTQYIVTGTSSIGCSANDTVNITINPNPIIQTNNDTAICITGSVQLNTTGANTYGWLPITNLNTSGIANPIATPISTTKYFVTGTITATGCFAKDSVTITVNQRPTITKTNDTSICSNTSAQLLVNGGVNYQWSPAITLNNPLINNPVATPVNNTTYYVTVTDGNSCSNNDSIKVSIRPAPVFAVIPDTLVCSLNAVQLYASGGDIYSWSPALLVSNPNISNPLSNTNNSTTYTVNITESTCNVSATLTTNLSLAPPLTMNISKSNDIDCSNGSAQLLATGAVTYNWLPAGSLSNAAIANPVASPLITQQYVVRGDDPSTGCVGYDSITVYVNFADNDNAYLMPSGFTPNNDGLNDCFGIKNWGVLEKLDFSIYNRWGIRIFYTSNPSECWDGTYQGEPCDIDTYIYIIHASTPCGNFERKGNVTLIR